MDIINMNFPITVYGNLEKLNDVISIGRCRIFYKYANRNATYITDEFAEQLIKTLPYTPVKGIYDDDANDYEDHGEDRDEGRIYGIVPSAQEMNFAWEDHLDEDGVTRTYACVNVYYYTALYKEAKEITGKGQSMELYKDSIVGSWQIINGKRYYVFEKASFLGLQVLGDNVEPCFEGAAFFSLYETIKNWFEKIEKHQNNFQNYGQGGSIMPTITFKISDSQKHDLLWSLLNVNYNEEGNWTIEYGICDIYDEYAVVKNYAENIYERVYYQKEDDTDSLKIYKKKRCYIIDVSEEEYGALQVLRSLNNDTYENIDTEYQNMVNQVNEQQATINALNEENSKFSTKIEELTNNNNTLSIERETVQALCDEATNKFAAVSDELTAANATIQSLTNERDELATYKKNILDNEKKAIINSYADQLDATIIATYIENMDNYSSEQLDMELTYKLKLSRPEIFSKNLGTTTHIAYVPKNNEGNENSIEELLARYEKKH